MQKNKFIFNIRGFILLILLKDIFTTSETSSSDETTSEITSSESSTDSTSESSTNSTSESSTTSTSESSEETSQSSEEESKTTTSSSTSNGDTTSETTVVKDSKEIDFLSLKSKSLCDSLSAGDTMLISNLSTKPDFLAKKVSDVLSFLDTTLPHSKSLSISVSGNNITLELEVSFYLNTQKDTVTHKLSSKLEIETTMEPLASKEKEELLKNSLKETGVTLSEVNAVCDASVSLGGEGVSLLIIRLSSNKEELGVVPLFKNCKDSKFSKIKVDAETMQEVKDTEIPTSNKQQVKMEAERLLKSSTDSEETSDQEIDAVVYMKAEAASKGGGLSTKIKTALGVAAGVVGSIGIAGLVAWCFI